MSGIKNNRRTFMVGAALLATGAVARGATAPYPDRMIRFIVPSAPGSGTDILTRILSKKLTDRWHQTIVVDNREGAGGVIGTEIAAKSAPDGYTLCMGFTGPLAASPALLKDIPYNPLKDLETVTLIDSSPAVLVVSPSVPATSVEELIALAKAKPGFITFGSAGYGTIGHVSGELFKQKSETNMLHVPYKSVSQAVTDVVGGQIKMLFHVAPAVMPLVKAGKLRALGVTSLKRWAILPELPAIAEAGLPGYQTSVWHGVVVSAGTPPALIETIYQNISNVMKSDDVRKQFAAQWTEPLGTTPAEFAKFLKSEVETYANIAKSAGLRAG